MRPACTVIMHNLMVHLGQHVEGISQDRTVGLTSFRPPKNLGEVSMSRRERGTYSCCNLR